MYKKLDEVVIYPRGDKSKEAEGVAVLIDKVGEKRKTEKWLVQFKGENRLFERILMKPQPAPKPPKKARMNKIVRDGAIKYYYGERSDKKVLGLNRPSHSEAKYEYSKSRRK